MRCPYRIFPPSSRDNDLKFLLRQRAHRELALPDKCKVLQPFFLLHLAEGDGCVEGFDWFKVNHDPPWVLSLGS